MKKFKPSFLTLSLMAAGLSLHAIPTFAQETSAELDDASEVEVIEVKGFRSSLIKSLNTKRFSDTVVDAISADDIGGLPDVSIADALSRIPGVTSIRIDGQSGELNIRGLSGNYVFSTFNGREMVSASGGRTVQFDQFPSELISQAQVFKSQKASLIEGGVAGTVELKTANALDMDENSQFRISLQGAHNNVAADNPDSGSLGHRFTVAYKQKFLDDTLGVSTGYSRLFEPTVSTRFVNLQFDPKTPLYEGFEPFLNENGTILVSDGFEINEQGGENKRDSFVTAIDYLASDSVKIRVDGFYSKFDDEAFDRGFRVQGLANISDARRGPTMLLTDPIIANGALIGGTFARDPQGLAVAAPGVGSPENFRVEVQGDDNTTESEVIAVGFNLEWNINDALSMTFDLSHTEAEEILRDRVLRMALFEDSSVATPVVDDNFVLSYQLNGLDTPTVNFNQDFTDVNKLMVSSAESYPFFEENEANAVAVDFKYELDTDIVSSVEFGLRSSERDHSLRRARFVHGTTDQAMRSGNYITYDRDEDGNFVEVQRFQPFQLSADMVQEHTLGGDLGNMPSFLTVNNSQILDAWLPNVDQTPTLDWNNSWTILNGRDVKEEVLSAYIQANLNFELGDIPVTGNIGLRAIRTEQTARGLANVGSGNGQPIADDNGVINDSFIRVNEGPELNHYLPSINLNFGLTDNQQLRFAYSKGIARPELEKMGIRSTWSWDSNSQKANLDASTNPFLEPFEADQIDLSYEYYFSDTDGAITVAIFNKDISNFPTNLTAVDFDYASVGITIPEADLNERFDENDELINYTIGEYKRAVNIEDAGYIRGIELAYTQNFDFLPGMWKGLGVNLNYSYTKSDITLPSLVPGEDGRDGPLPGLSPRVWSATVYYSYDDKFEARINARFRDDYVNEQVAIGAEQQAYFAEETIYSAQASYNYSDNLQFFVSADNLTDEANRSYFAQEERTGTIQWFGRTIYFGVNYNM
ncbi:MAG: iron complex outermembrane receptor protein [Paraglaciecola sp.]|jgi:iron complex outermembrane receptor protein